MASPGSRPDAGTAARSPVNDAIARLTAAMLPQVFDDLALPEDVQVALLGLEEAPSLMVAFRRRDLVLTRKQLTTASQLLSISQDLVVLLPDRAQRREWVVRENPILDGRSPLEVISTAGAAGVALVARQVHRAKRRQEFAHLRRPLSTSTATARRADGVEL